MPRVFFCLLILAATADARVIALSLDGAGWHVWRQDPAARELAVLDATAGAGSARPMIPAFPSTTANSHAALYTGVWAGRNGIASNDPPMLPRAAHTFLERGNGFRSTFLAAEPLWVAAARQGRSVAAFQVTQAYPFTPQSAGLDLPQPPVVCNGYQTARITPHAAIRPANVKDEDGAFWTEGLPRAGRPQRFVTWTTGPYHFHAAIWGDALAVAIDPGRWVLVRAEPLESTPPLGRPLARHYSDPLPLPDGNAVSFRLFHLAPRGSDFLLHQNAVSELACAGEKDLAAQLIATRGPFVGNGPSQLLRQGEFGAVLAQGGDGTAERRYLEAVEYVVRQAASQMQWLWERRQPDLFLGYLNFPDETDHLWLRPDPDARITACRRWAYAAVNRGLEALASLAGPDDTLLFMSDHGMTGVSRHLAVNTVLHDAGLLAVDAEGRMDAARSRAVAVRSGVLLNTTDWKDGVVPPEDRRKLLREVEKALTSVKDPRTGGRIVTRFFDPARSQGRYGYECAACADLSFDVAPGWGMTTRLESGPVRVLAEPAGEHGFWPERDDMQAILIGRGPGLQLPRRPTAVDAAAVIAKQLGIAWDPR
ncbi:MAG: alkaline phosphatase family protein [Bryobacterales bacterium]|nr:alkaline phosphatase family protein [Bryobacterales bacterium]